MFSYIDPSATSMIISAIATGGLAVISVIVIAVRKSKKKIKDKLGIDLDKNKEKDEDLVVKGS